MLCVTLTPENLDDVFAADLSRADAVEVRLDYLHNPRDAAHIRWDQFPVPVIATCRGRQFGGLFEGSIEEEIALLSSAARNGAQYVDLDYRIARSIPGATVIASFHDFKQTPSNLATIFDAILAADAGIAKIATQVNAWADNARLFEQLARPRNKPAIVLGMGDMGQITRIAGSARGGFLTYAAAAAQREAAPGQLTLDDMLDVYRFRRISASTQLLGILGMPVGHSLSPVFHNRAFDIAGLDFAYGKFPAPSIQDFMENASRIGIHGFSVTIPHKIAVMPFLARVTPEASGAGAVNTVSQRDGQWIGDNTDVHGVRAALRSGGFDPAGKSVVILGRGGAAKAAAAALKDAREVALFGRGQLAEGGSRSCDLLINATPIGMFPNVEASPVEGLIHADTVFDMVYNPKSTRLLRTAAEQGRMVISGKAMFMAQAARQFEIWTGQAAPTEVFGNE